MTSKVPYCNRFLLLIPIWEEKKNIESDFPATFPCLKDVQLKVQILLPFQHVQSILRSVLATCKGGTVSVELIVKLVKHRTDSCLKLLFQWVRHNMEPLRGITLELFLIRHVTLHKLMPHIFWWACCCCCLFSFLSVTNAANYRKTKQTETWTPVDLQFGFLSLNKTKKNQLCVCVYTHIFKCI